MRLRSQAKKKVEDSSFSSHFPWFLAESPFLWILQQGLNVFNLGSLQLFSDVVENRHVLVVYHLHWQTGRCTVWANHGKQNFGLVNFVPESHLPFVQIGIHRQTAVKALKLESKIVLKKHSTKFLYSRKFSAGTTQNVVFRLLFNRIFRKLLVNGKPPLSRPSSFLRVSAWRFCTTWLTVCRRPIGRWNKSW